MPCRKMGDKCSRVGRCTTTGIEGLPGFGEGLLPSRSCKVSDDLSMQIDFWGTYILGSTGSLSIWYLDVTAFEIYSCRPKIYY